MHYIYIYILDAYSINVIELKKVSYLYQMTILLKIIYCIVLMSLKVEYGPTIFQRRRL